MEFRPTPGFLAPEEHDVPPFRTADRNAAHIFHKFTVIERKKRKVMQAIFARDGIHPAQGFCIKTIRKHEGLSQRELADYLHIERATATVMLQKMERAGLIERRADPDDMRITRIYLTPRAIEADDHTDEACEAFISSCFEGLNEEQRTALTIGLEITERNMDHFCKTLKYSDLKEGTP